MASPLIGGPSAGREYLKKMKGQGYAPWPPAKTGYVPGPGNQGKWQESRTSTDPADGAFARRPTANLSNTGGPEDIENRVRRKDVRPGGPRSVPPPTQTPDPGLSYSPGGYGAPVSLGGGLTSPTRTPVPVPGPNPGGVPVWNPSPAPVPQPTQFGGTPTPGGGWGMKVPPMGIMPQPAPATGDIRMTAINALRRKYGLEY